MSQFNEGKLTIVCVSAKVLVTVNFHCAASRMALTETYLHAVQSLS